MTKKEIIWRELLYQALEKHTRTFTQKDLAARFGFSLSTIFNALSAPRDIKAVSVTGRNFTLIDPEKLLYLWATQRKLAKDIRYETHVTADDLAAIEAEVPPDAIYAAYSAYHQKFGETPADYDTVHVYTENIDAAQRRFPLKRGKINFVALAADPFLKTYGAITPIGQIFVDIWNLPDWYSREFTKAVLEKIA